MSASCAVDGILRIGCNSHTLRSLNPWFKIDLGTSYEILYLKIYHSANMPFLKISIGDSSFPPSTNALCKLFTPFNSDVTFECNTGVLEGRYIFAYQDGGANNFLYFEEIMAFINL